MQNVAQCTGGAASTTGFREGIPLVTGAGSLGDSIRSSTQIKFSVHTAAVDDRTTRRDQTMPQVSSVQVRQRRQSAGSLAENKLIIERSMRQRLAAS